VRAKGRELRKGEVEMEGEQGVRSRNQLKDVSKKKAVLWLVEMKESSAASCKKVGRKLKESRERSRTGS